MKQLILPVAFLVFAAAGCKNSSEKENTTTDKSATTIPAPAANPAQPVGAPTNIIPAPTTTTTTSTSTPTKTIQPTPTPTISAPAKVGAGLNPEHGQPGHRCDISVGAPLNSKPNQPTQPVLQPSINTAPQKIVTPTTAPVINPSAAPVTVAAGMNPQHGQPGHRCDIAVGAPLNSKPNQ